MGSSGIAASIIEAMEHDGFEWYTPPEFPGAGRAHDVVVHKSKDPGAFVALMAGLRVPREDGRP